MCRQDAERMEQNTGSPEQQCEQTDSCLEMKCQASVEGCSSTKEEKSAVERQEIRKIDYSAVMVVTNRKLCRVSDSDRELQDALCRQLEKVCSLHPAAVILREKDLEESDYAALAGRVAEICGKYGVECIYHSYTGAARSAGVKQIHLPLWRMEEMTAEERAVFDRIGVSVHSVNEAVRAEKLGAAYLTAGHIYTTDCKKGVPPRGLAFLKEVCDAVSIPVWAIGGIDLEPDKLTQVRQAGAAGGCIMSAMMRI